MSEISGMIADIKRQLDVLTGKLAELGNLPGGSVCECSEALSESVADEDASEVGVPEGIAQENPVQEAPVQEEPLLAIDDSEEAIELDVPFIDDSKPAVVDALMRSRAWMNDIPGSSVQDIRSAISLNDRLYFIKNLFSDDPTLFQSVVADLNGYSSFEDAARWLLDRFKGWDPDSDVVYRFMMAVRRKLK